jgi:uncharacterized protein
LIFMKPPHQKIVVIYHGDCRDGFGGAWAAWKKFGNKAAYLPAFDRFSPPCTLKDKEIYLIDYGYPAEVTKKLMRENLRVTAIDHHITAREVVKTTYRFSFALDHSGAVLAWRYFHPGRPVPFLLQCVEAGDLWKWRVPHAKAVLAIVNLLDHDFAIWNRMARDMENRATRSAWVAKGDLLLRYDKRLMEGILPHVQTVRFAGHRAFAVNASRHFADDLGRVLARRSCSLAIIWSECNDHVRVSLRSDGSVDVAKIAQKFGGGGHKVSAGFSLKLGAKFPWKIVQKLR